MLRSHPVTPPKISIGEIIVPKPNKNAIIILSTGEAKGIEYTSRANKGGQIINPRIIPNVKIRICILNYVIGKDIKIFSHFLCSKINNNLVFLEIFALLYSLNIPSTLKILKLWIIVYFYLHPLSDLF